MEQRKKHVMKIKSWKLTYCVGPANDLILSKEIIQGIYPAPLNAEYVDMARTEVGPEQK